MSKKTYSLLVLGASFLFILLNSYLMYNEKVLLAIVPLAFIILLLVLFAPNIVFYSLFFFAPLSVPFRSILPILDFDFWFPTEPLIFMLLLVIILKSLYMRYIERRISNYAVFWAIALYLAWMFIATISSQLPLVSVKYVLVRVWFIAVFFYLAYLLLLKNPKAIYKMMGLYMAGLSVVVIITFLKQLQRGLFEKQVAHMTCAPFFPDHTSYGAVLAFIVPISVAMTLSVKNKWCKLLLCGLSCFFAFALLLSYTRAAWLSLFVAIGVWVLWLLKIRFRTVLITGAVVVLLGFSFWGDIMRWMNSNETASSNGLREHIASITNVTTDDSNVERLNRWTSALRMFSEKPLLGFGPGTYQFLYAPYQSASLRTRESSNVGKKGNAHSEYLGLLSESGIVALLAFVMIIVFTIAKAFKVINKLQKCPERTMLLGLLMGFITYIIHAFMNNFLDMDKVAALYWVTAAFVIAIDARLLKVESED